jgi:hypothetical protein
MLRLDALNELLGVLVLQTVDLVDVVDVFPINACEMSGNYSS